MGKILGRNALIYLFVLLVVVLLDLSTKEIAQRYLEARAYEPLPVLRLYLIHNRGAAFGLFSDMPDAIRLPLLLIAPLIAFFVTFLYSNRDGSLWIPLSMGMIGGGALGNLYDRLFLGEVRDFIHLHIGKYYWPAFNLADASITLSILLILLSYLKNRWHADSML